MKKKKKKEMEREGRLAEYILADLIVRITKKLIPLCLIGLATKKDCSGVLGSRVAEWLAG